MRSTQDAYKSVLNINCNIYNELKLRVDFPANGTLDETIRI